MHLVFSYYNAVLTMTGNVIGDFY